MGEAAAAVCSYEKVLVLDPNSTAAKNDMNQAKTVQQYMESAESSYGKADYRRVSKQFIRQIDIASGNQGCSWDLILSYLHLLCLSVAFFPTAAR